MLKKITILITTICMTFLLNELTIYGESTDTIITNDITTRASYISRQNVKSPFYYDGETYNIDVTYKVYIDSSTGKIIDVDLDKWSSNLPNGKWTVCELISVYYISNYQVGVTVDVNIMSWLGVEKVSRIQVSLNSTGPIC